MSRRRFNWQAARDALRQSCPSLRTFIDATGNERYPVRGGVDLFQALARSIIYQQLSGKAAGTIHARFKTLFDDQLPAPQQTLALGEDALRSVGLSGAKAAAILDLARHQVDGLLPGPRRLAAMSDEEIIDAITRVRGIGPWTVQMHLIFYLGRPDVMPATDLAIRKGVMHIYRTDTLPPPQKVLAMTRHLAPFRSAAAWYFWRASEVVLP